MASDSPALPAADDFSCSTREPKLRHMWPAPSKAPRIHGIEVPPRRFTGWAALYFLGFFCLPLLTFCFLVDLALYLLFTRYLDSCYAVLCWFD